MDKLVNLQKTNISVKLSYFMQYLEFSFVNKTTDGSVVIKQNATAIPKNECTVLQ